MRRRTRVGMVGVWARTVVLALPALLPLAACGPDADDLDYTGVAGQKCQDCELCAGFIGSCVCETCTEYAVDLERKQLLVCAGIWKVQKECPGGVSAACARYGYDITCLNEKGEPK